MAITIKTQPDNHSAAYSALPVRVLSSNIGISDEFKYTINIVYNQVTSFSAVAVYSGDFVYTKLTTAAHNFEVGDSILIDGGISDPQYTDYYTVIAVPDSTNVVLDMLLGAPVSGVLKLHNVIKYKMSPDQENEAKLDISNVLKDFVSKNIEDLNDIFSGSDTRFNYEIIIGEELEYVLDFEDNTTTIEVQPSVGNNVAFYNTSITSLVGIPFQVGDSIEIQQDEYEWVYTDNGLYNGKLGFTGPTFHNFLPGQTVTVTGQQTHPYYNGVVGVNTNSVTNSTILTTDKDMIGSTPAEGGSIFGTPRPSYNTVVQIAAIYIETTIGLGLVIETNQTYKGATQPIPGTIKFADNRITTNYVEETIQSLVVYNAHLNRLDYSNSFYDKFTIQSRPSTENFLSTLLEYQGINNDKKYRIERSTKSWLLAHATHPGLSDRVRYLFYNKSGVILSIIELLNVSGNTEDYYIPVGIDQLLASGNTTLVAGSALSTIVDEISQYNLSVYSAAVSVSEWYRFELNDDCSRYDILHLMWKDSYGSWLSYPFKYISTDSTEFERKTYYKQEGSFNDDNTFGYDSYGRGETSYFGRSRDKVNLNSGWIEDFENVLIKDLLQSTDVYLQKADGTLLGCVVENKSFTFKNRNENEMYQYSIAIRLSNNQVKY